MTSRANDEKPTGFAFTNGVVPAGSDASYIHTTHTHTRSVLYLEQRWVRRGQKTNVAIVIDARGEASREPPQGDIL